MQCLSDAGFGGFKSDERFQGNYGGGIKYQANKWFGVRIDVRGLTGIAPRFGLPTGPSSLGTAYIPGGKILNGIQATAGLRSILGIAAKLHRWSLRRPPPPPPPPPQPINPGAISASPTTVCPGDAVSLSFERLRS